MNLRSIALAVVMTIAATMVFASAADDGSQADNSKLTLLGFVKDALSRQDLVKAKVYVTDTLGEHVDSVTTGDYIIWAGDHAEERGFYSFKVPRCPGIYNLEVVMPGYQNYYHTVRIGQIGRREISRDIPDIFMQRAPRQLDGVTVTASKVKFYNKGDTVVFNADAFELAEGSMLDALIKQLPGVELREGGQIYVNGEFVENLLLNGKDFFNGNNELMLDNLSAYTVSNIEVYRRQSDFEKWAGSPVDTRSLVMDVKLKREYNAGWIMNFEAGAGTEDRYMGRAFVNRFTNNSRITFMGNVNNLNDNRKPGESTTWTPETNTAGTMRTQLAALNYYVEHRDKIWRANGQAIVRHSTQNDRSDVNRTNFLPSGRTYDYSYSGNRINNLYFYTLHNYTYEKKTIYTDTDISFSYRHSHSDVTYLGATFDREQPTMTAGMIDTIYRGDPSMIAALINRTVTTTLDHGHGLIGYLANYTSIKIPNSNDHITLGITGNLSSAKNEIWRTYGINYGQNPVEAVKRNQYFDNSPNRNVSFQGNVHYILALSEEFSASAGYSYNHSQADRDSYMYALDRLSEYGVAGTLPEGYLSVFDAAGSYRSHTIENIHTLMVRANYWSDNFWFYLRPSLQFIDRNFDYIRNDQSHRVCQRHSVVSIPSYSTMINYSFGSGEMNGRKFNRHTFRFSLTVDPTLPDPVKMVDVTDSNDPQNIWLGNPSLTYQSEYKNQLDYTLNVPLGNYLLNNTVQLEYDNTHNAIVNGYSYDTSTGVRTNRTYNVAGGNYTAKVHLYPRLQFGSKGQFTASYFFGMDYISSTDIIGINANEPSRSDVDTWWQVHKADFSWQLGKQQLGLDCEVNSRHTVSDRADFSAITATHTKWSLRGQFKLPKGFGISTDITLYTRRGYGSELLNTTDPVWNARLSYAVPKTGWVMMLDGFDMLHRLSNVSYAVNAQGRVITYTNVLPRYVMLHVQYKLNIQPKKKIIDNRAKW